MNKLLLIGDVHGKVEKYHEILKSQPNYEYSIQLGDFGFEEEHEWFLNNHLFGKNYILFGNHDYYPKINDIYSCRDYGPKVDIAYEGEFTKYLIEREIFFVRGAYSIDQAYRKPNIDYFHNEELIYREMEEAVYYYTEYRPKIMLSHDCPQQVREEVFGIRDKSMTSNGLQVMFENFQPEIWIFGHHHRSVDIVINGTRFICLKELETILL